jgi:hypothetical protein
MIIPAAGNSIEYVNENIRRVYQNASVWLYVAREIFPSCDLFNSRAIFPEYFELVPVITPEAQTGLFFGTNGDFGLTLHVQPACPRR